MKVKPTRSMPPADQPKALPSSGPLYNELRARAARHNMAGVLDHCTWCGNKTHCLAGGAVVCPTCDVVVR